jgi:uncharacterized membrane protein
MTDEENSTCCSAKYRNPPRPLPLTLTMALSMAGAACGSTATMSGFSANRSYLTKSGWWRAAGFIALCAVPIAAGAVRLGGLTGGAAVTPKNARFLAAPVPIALHIIGVSMFCLLGALQFVPEFRRRRPTWHRFAGRLLVIFGLVGGFAGLWMTQFYPRIEGDGPLLYAFRLLFGSVMVVSITLGFVAIRRRDILAHRAWMTRAYAIFLSSGTQAALHLPFLLIGKPDELTRALLHGAGWVLNLVIAERFIIRRHQSAHTAWIVASGASEAVLTRESVAWF